MAFDVVSRFLLVPPKPGDSEETRQQKELINHAVQTYFQFAAAENVASNLVSRFFPRQVLVNRISGQEIGPEDVQSNIYSVNAAAGLLKLLAGKGRLF